MSSHNYFIGEIGNIDVINVFTVCEIQKVLDPRDVISLVFLLYNVPLTALQRLTIFQKVSKESSNWTTNLLSDWVVDIQIKDPLWRHKFIEALAICQLYEIIRKLGLNVVKVKEQFFPDQKTTSVYIDPMKKILFKLCECMKHTQLLEFKEALTTYSIDTAEYESCELIILKLITDNRITIKSHDIDLKIISKTIENISGLNSIAADLIDIHNHIHCTHFEQPSCQSPKADTSVEKSNSIDDGNVYVGNLDVFEQFNDLMEDDVSLDNFESDNKSYDFRYPIKNLKDVGVCYIINQVIFSRPKDGHIDQSDNCLDSRISSIQDKLALEDTMRKLNFEVISHDNLDKKNMMTNIKNIIKYRVKHDHSIFMLCLLSHGIKDHVYAADSVPVKIDDIQNLFDADEAHHLRGIPKIMIIQACQVNADKLSHMYHADAPVPKKNYNISKSDCLIYNATARELEAYRHQKHGSIFIYALCRVLKKHAPYEDLITLFTRVNNYVQQICKRIEKNQTPQITFSLTKKLFLSVPKMAN